MQKKKKKTPLPPNWVVLCGKEQVEPEVWWRQKSRSLITSSAKHPLRSSLSAPTSTPVGCFSRGYSRVRGRKKKGGGRRGGKHVGGMKQQQAHLHPPGLRESPPSGISRALPLPPKPSVPAPHAKKKKKNGPVFEDACRGGLCSGHRITVGVTGLDTSVRCYALTHILTRPF